MRPPIQGYDSRSISVGCSCAFLGAVTAQLRVVTVSLSDKAVHVTCYVDGEISETTTEALSVAETEMWSDLEDGIDLRFDICRLDYPNKIPSGKEGTRWIFERYEELS